MSPIFHRLVRGHGSRNLREASPQTAACWGPQGSRETPTEKFMGIEAGSHGACGPAPDRTVACWGVNLHGQ